MTTRWLIAFGVTVSIETDDPRVFPFLDEQLPAFPDDPVRSAPALAYRVVRVQARGRVIVIRGRRTIATANELWGASVRLVEDLQSALAHAAADWTFVHAGVVKIGGRALLLPARSGAGKSTLVAALLRAGAVYGSDEFAVFDQQGNVHPYSRRLVLRTEPRSVTRLCPEDFGSRAFSRHILPGAVLFTEFRPDGRLEAQPISAGHVVMRLLEHCLDARSRPSVALRTLSAVAGSAPGFISTRGEADTVARALIDRFEDLWSDMAV
jgi:hypothetical protein